MATLTGELISETYDSLLKVTDNNTITGIKKRITDGFGNDIPLLLSSTDLEIDGTFILSALTDLAPASKFLSLKADNSVGFRTSSELLSDIGGASSASISGTTGRLSKFTSSGAVGNSILNEIGNAIHLTDGTSSYASFGINNPGIDNDAYIGSTINNDFLIKVNNTEALRIDTAFRLKIANIQNALGDTDKFLVSEDGVVKYRTGTELRSDIGAGVGSVTSVGLTMPVAFEVANSPITSAGTLAVTAVGTASQYIRGDGQLATLPTGAGGGSAVNYYLNGSVASGVAGYQQMDNTAIIGTGTDFTLTGNGLIAQFLTDIDNPNRLLIPGGAWNLEMFFQVSSSGGNAKFYVDLFKYDGTTFTSIASGVTNPEEITGGTSIDLYLTSLGVPETALLITDRLAIRVYIVDNSGGRTVTLHTEDNTLCQVTTTFAGGISALNGLTANTQYFAVGTSGTDFNISSLLDTHTFNIPSASATNRGLITTGTQTIAGAKTFTDLRIENRGTSQPTMFENTSATAQGTNGFNTFGFNSDSNIYFSDGTALNSGVLAFNNTNSRTYTLPNATGTLALTSDLHNAVTLSAIGSTPNANGATLTGQVLNLQPASASFGGVVTTGTQTFAGEKTFNSSSFGQTVNIQNSGTGYGLRVQSGSAYFQDDVIIQGFLKSPFYTYTLPSATGTLALTSNITSAISGTTNYIPKFTGANTIGNSVIYESTGGNIGIGETNPVSYKLQVKGIDGGGIQYEDTNGVRTLLGSYLNKAIIGTLSTNQVGIWTNNSEKINIDVSGNTSIGYTTNPSLYKLDVNGTGRFSGLVTFSSSVAIGIATPTDFGASYKVLDVYGTNAMSITRSSGGVFGQVNAAGTDALYIGTRSNHNVYLTANNSNIVTLNASTGAATFSSSVTALGGGIDTTLGDVMYFSNINYPNAQKNRIRNSTSATNIGNILVFETGNGTIGSYNSNQLVLRGDGNVGIGTTTPSRKVHIVSGQSSIPDLCVQGADVGQGWLGFGTTNDYGIQGGTDYGAMNFRVNNTERMRITSGGNVLIGTTSSTYQTTNRTAIVANGVSNAIYGLAVGGVNKGYFYSEGTNILLMSEDANGYMSFGTAQSERMRITSGGNVLIGTTTDFDSGILCSDGGTSFVPFAAKVGSTSNSAQIFFRNPNGIVGSITTNGTATSFNTSSDYRLKQDLKDYKAIDLISKIKTYDYEWKCDNTRAYGVVAHELQEIVPQAVTGEKDAEQMQGVDYSKLVPILVKAIQESVDIINDLKSRIEKLESK